MEEGGNEFVRIKRRSIKRRSKEEDPAPSPYNSSDPEWSKAVAVERPCAIPGNNHLSFEAFHGLAILMANR